MRAFIAKKHIGLLEREISLLEYGYYDFQNPPYMALRQQLITWMAATGTSFSPLPAYRARHGTATMLPTPTAWR
jgi:hypothetical protein